MKNDYPSLPKPLKYSTGYEEEIRDAIHVYFKEVYEWLGFSERAAQIFFTFPGQALSSKSESQALYSGAEMLRVGDDRLLSMCCNGQLIAGALIARNDTNYVFVTFMSGLDNEDFREYLLNKGVMAEGK